MSSPRAVLRLVVAALAVGVLLLVFATTGASVNDASTRDASAIQIIQVYTEGMFLAVVTIGIAIAAYIGSRAGEP